MAKKQINNDGLYVEKNRYTYKFYNDSYNMYLYLEKNAVEFFLKHPGDNFRYGESEGNCLNSQDRTDVILYLTKELTTKKYKTVSSCVRYSKKDSLKENLEYFTVEELYKYLNKKRKEKQYVKSSS